MQTGGAWDRAANHVISGQPALPLSHSRHRHKLHLEKKTHIAVYFAATQQPEHMRGKHILHKIWFSFRNTWWFVILCPWYGHLREVPNALWHYVTWCQNRIMNDGNAIHMIKSQCYFIVEKFCNVASQTTTKQTTSSKNNKSRWQKLPWFGQQNINMTWKDIKQQEDTVKNDKRNKNVFCASSPSALNTLD